MAGRELLAVWRQTVGCLAVTLRVSRDMVNLGPKAKRAGNLPIANPF